MRNKAVIRHPPRAGAAEERVHPGELGFMLRFLSGASVIKRCCCASELGAIRCRSYSPAVWINHGTLQRDGNCWQTQRPMGAELT